ncbi:GNAT family N-acetyltransferase [Paucibacter sp. Y2R2-4]|uniref:GNAT family N-acetyltransferase n=1 Tax=Paucibacter sp. Y2R2-4 TaxID=2893553 RepID=UPI0021E39331|nr:N-acetyltransferase [Paucibacter sp. Y2R2-4]MCV2350451.1 GNAT family N-acetyltransferase [Paucibacter sp. Y2R2-4]
MFLLLVSLSRLIRPMQPADLAEVLRIQAACFTELVPESEASLAAKLRAAPEHCWVAAASVEPASPLAAYLFALPWQAESPPLLDAPDCSLPAQPDCLYLHDLSVDPQARGRGLAQALVQRFLDRLEASGLDRACLIAVQNSSDFWGRWGFQPSPLAASLSEKLSSYGPDVAYLERLAPVPQAV